VHRVPAQEELSCGACTFNDIIGWEQAEVIFSRLRPSRDNQKLATIKILIERGMRTKRINRHRAAKEEEGSGDECVALVDCDKQRGGACVSHLLPSVAEAESMSADMAFDCRMVCKTLG
jgi:hypothetical protein